MFIVLREYKDEHGLFVTEYTNDGETVSNIIKTSTDPNALPNLENVKIQKISLLKSQCELAIENGFVSAVNGHMYRTNRDDQVNMIGQKDELMDDETILNVPWKTEDVGYVMHTREDWLKIYYDGFAHKKTQLFKYDQLKQQVLACTTLDEIQVIEW